MIIVDQSSVDMEANEGTTIRLMCNSTGHPAPVISWSVRPAGTPLGSDKTRGKTTPNLRPVALSGN